MLLRCWFVVLILFTRDSRRRLVPLTCHLNTRTGTFSMNASSSSKPESNITFDTIIRVRKFTMAHSN
ncbi:hypothetical protein CIPAW_09G103700 [Carya illinoinensis]|uniref:Secreted protein n=1 Tax=Carya illinoinensis TaxID=32201 RepID=A0A8T1PK23_CARIL|nr:hypothetical protein CIPAW_09G103700 [Carya illinoinensis]